MKNNLIEKMNETYRYIYIVDSMSLWDKEIFDYDFKNDLILTYDFELKHHISELGGNSFFIDHLVDEEIMQKNNFLIYAFFKDWHFDKNDKDIFTYKDIDFGFSLRLEFWNDFVSFIRMYICLLVLNKINYEKMFVVSKDNLILKVLKKLKLEYTFLDKKQMSALSFYFPISQWMDAKVNPRGIRAFLYKTREFVSTFYEYSRQLFDKILLKKKRQTVFIQEYHPTKNILSTLRKDNNLNILLANFSRGSKLKDNLKERIIPILGNIEKYKKDSDNLMKNFKKLKCKKLILNDGACITFEIYEIIEEKIGFALPKILRTLDGCINYLDKNNIDLEILIANMGHTATLFDMVCKKKNIPSYLIINGLLGPEYQDDSKYATFINSYSSNIKNHYFKGMQNIVELGDPRMDMYRPNEQNKINRTTPTVTIGASGFNCVDLNSYVAVEFDFMYDILCSLKTIINNNININIKVKVRPNGYKNQYKEFIKKFFPDLDILVEDTIPMKDVLKKTDFYISIYSQTLFEASCLGIPVVYYKKDNEIMDPPFDNKSELVIVSTITDLVQAFYDFQNKHTRYDAFLDRQIMEKYMGHLDGKNLQRNIDFIYKLLDKCCKND